MAAHRYWRLRSLANNGGGCTTITELIMATTPGGATVCSGGTIIKSSEQAGWEAPKAFDGIVSGDQGWASANGDIDGAWIGYDFGAGNSQDIVEVRVMSRTHSSYLNQTPKLFFIQYSDDGTNWYQRGPSSGIQTGWTANEIRTFSIGNSDTILSSLSLKGDSGRVAIFSTLRPSSFKKSTTGGDGSLGGTVLESSAPVQGAIITVFDETTHAVAGQGTTNILGDWVVDNINPNKTYFAVAKHPDDLWEMKISSRRRPSDQHKIRMTMCADEHARCSITTDPLDAYWSNVIAVMDNDASNGLTSYTDGKGFAVACSNATVSTPVTGISGSTVSLNTTAGYAEGTPAVDLLSGGDFCAEAWVRIGTTMPPGSYGFGIIGSLNNVSNGWQLRMVTSGLEWVYPGGGAISSPKTWAPNTTYHVAAYRIGTQHYIAIDGVPSAVSISNRVTSPAAIRIGTQTYGGGSDLKISYRLTVGQSRYTSSPFTPKPFGIY